MLIALEGEATIEGVKLGSSSTGDIIISPGEKRLIGFTLPIDMSRIYTSQDVAERVLFNGTIASFNIKVAFGLQPLVKASIGGGFNTTIGPAVSGLSTRLYSINQINETHTEARVEIEFTNNLPIQLEGLLQATLTPYRQEALRSQASTTLLVQPSQRYNKILAFTIPTSEGPYLLETSISVGGYTYSWREVLG